MSDTFKMVGKLKYDPVVGKAANQWWVILELPEDILDYYKYWIEKESGKKLSKPLFGSHISVLRGEEPSDTFKEYWKLYDGKEVTISYSIYVGNEGNYYWLPVLDNCDLNNVRKSLGLLENVEHGYHLTIGKLN